MKPVYVVLTETEDSGGPLHLVCIRYSLGLPWLRVVAAFQSRDRAEAYAEFENTFAEDDDPAWPHVGLSIGLPAEVVA